jgi:hypothetical protein
MQFEMMMKEKTFAETQLLWREGEDATFVCLIYKGGLKLTNSMSRQEW